MALKTDLSRNLLALALGGAGGWLAASVNLPLPWMIGAMAATTVAAVAGAPIALPTSLRALMVAVLGVMLGSGFSPEILGLLDQWALSLASLVLYAALAGGLGMIFFRRVCGYDRVTAYFAAAPGGLSEMALVGGAMGGDSRVISLSHATRVLLVVLTLPFAFQLLFGYDPANKPAAGAELATLTGFDLAVLAACGICGYAAARALKLPAAAIVGPMICSAAAHLAGWTSASPPTLLVAAAQVVIGTSLGCRFAGVAPGTIARIALAASGASVLLIAITVLFAVALHGLTGLPGEALVLAFAPGGLAEMSLIALAIASDAAFVGTHHIVRIFLIVVLAPLAFRLLGRRG